MARDSVATSILEFLTFQNPTVFEQKPSNKSNTRGKNWWWPKQVLRWHEFDDFNILKTSFGGSLFREACRGHRSLPHYPHIDESTDCALLTENDTRDLINKWTRTIVTAALNPISKEFHPAIWSKGDPPVGKQAHEPPPLESRPQRQQPRRESSKQARKPQKRTYHRLKSDSGSVAQDTFLSETSDTPSHHRKERFPKEYKPSSKWRSEWMDEQKLFNASGEWVTGKTKVNMAMPIRQAFSYCIQHMCRYGCILTSREAFIFRIRPRDGASRNQKDDEHDPSVLREQLIHNGLMEYVSIPWANCQEGRDTCQTWTVNLALWFMHVLAGNHYEVAWRYGGLQDEKLVLLDTNKNRNDQRPLSDTEEGDEDTRKEVNVEEDESSDSDDSDITVPFEFARGPKRRRSTDVEEEYCLSFSKRQALEV